MSTYGYVRVSTDGQTLDAQQATLKAAGAEKVFSEKQSGAKTSTPSTRRRKPTSAARPMMLDPDPHPLRRWRLFRRWLPFGAALAVPPARTARRFASKSRRATKLFKFSCQRGPIRAPDRRGKADVVELASSIIKSESTCRPLLA
jgi:Resolvase, N terminal domain